MKINLPNSLLAATTVILTSSFSANLPVQALTWTINNGTTDGTNLITGSFTVNDESITNPSITFSNIMVNSLTFTATNVVNVGLVTPSGGGISSIDWQKGSDSLSLVFNSPFLTTAGGTITLNDIVSDFNSNAVRGSVTGASQPTTAVPEPDFSFSFLVLGTIGAATAIGNSIFSKRNTKN